MTVDNSEFGKGVFDDDHPAPEQAEPPKVELTEREIAIASGADEETTEEEPEEKPDEEPAALSEPDTGEEQGTAEEPEDEPEETPQEFSASDKRLASLYGVTDQELEGLKTPEALHSFIDAIGKRGAEPKNPNSDDASDSEPKPASSESDEGGIDALIKDFKPIDLKEFEDEDNPLDDDSSKVVKALAQTQELVSALIKDRENNRAPSTSEQEQAAANARVLHDTLDGMPEIYGSSMKDGQAVEVSAKQQEAREAVIQTAETIYAGHVARGAEPPALKDIIDQAVQAVHGRQIAQAESKKESSSRQANLRRQSSMRRTTGNKSASKQRNNEKLDSDDAGSIAQHPSITEFWNRTQEENGVT